MMRRALIAVSAVSALALLAACSDDHDSMPMDSMPMDSMPMDSMPMGSMPGVPADADYTVADVEFAQGMIAHHEQAIAMAEIALDPTVGASPEVVDLARRIQAAQDPEIDQMTAWLTQREQALTMDMSDGHNMADMPGMMSAEDMERLPTLVGPEFDTVWLEMMIAHHQGAIEQANTVLADGTNPELAALANAIITAQQAEITEMEALLAA
ncbi:MAG TPA: DUF305 domain-containing protein [Acidimicrobiaceae bacterium]|nr:DUF305 domain-containing protein [Acidimicrobiaceae bacterium]